MIAVIVAMTCDGVIGRDGKLPWHLPEDLKNFKRLTSGHPVIMGRRTFESIGRPLPHRQNIVLSTRVEPIDGVTVARSLSEAFGLAQGDPVFIIGGASVYAAALPEADVLYVSWVDGTVEGDTSFPAVDWSAWKEESSERREGFTFSTYIRSAPEARPS